MDIWHVKCPQCGYEKKLNIGSYGLDQTLSDLNEDFAFYKLYICKKESQFVSANVHSRNFENKCPADGSQLFPVEELPPKKCPKCNANIDARKLDLSEVIG